MTRRPRDTQQNTELLRERARLYCDGECVHVFDTFAEARQAVLDLPAAEWPRYAIKHESISEPTP